MAIGITSLLPGMTFNSLFSSVLGSKVPLYSCLLVPGHMPRIPHLEGRIASL